MKEALEDAHRYPDLQYAEDRDGIAAHVGQSSDRIAVANGSTALLRDIVGLLVEAKSEAIFAEPSFAADRTVTGRM